VTDGQRGLEPAERQQSDDVSPQVASVTIIVPMMDRASDLDKSLASFLSQDYPDYRVCIVDMGSRDHLDDVLARHPSDRLEVLRRPRPPTFSFSAVRNIGARHSTSDLLLFLNGDNCFEGTTVLSTIVRDLQTVDPDRSWYARWRAQMEYRALTAARTEHVPTRFGARYAHCHGSPLMVERSVFDRLGGYNELLEDWGYEDTDLLARLELAGFGRIEIQGIGVVPVADEELSRIKHFRQRDRTRTWARNRLLSDYMIRRWGVAVYSGAEKPAQGGAEPTDAPLRLSAADRATLVRIREQYSSLAAEDLTLHERYLPRVTVIVLRSGSHRVEDWRCTVESLRSQEYPDLEVVVVDDENTDDWFKSVSIDGLLVGHEVQANRAPATIQARDWELGSGDVVAWLNAGDACGPGDARAAVSALLSGSAVAVVDQACNGHTPASAFSTKLERPMDPSTMAVRRYLSRGRSLWCHRLRVIDAMREWQETAAGVERWYTTQQASWPAHRVDQQPEQRCLVTVTFHSERSLLDVSVVSVRELQEMQVSINPEANDPDPSRWVYLQSFAIESGHTLRTTVAVNASRFQPGKYRVAVNVFFRDGTSLSWFQQPPRVIQIPGVPGTTPGAHAAG
jgi:glycosyltransferase involved in cell wall biosynthesis